jgi:hypothetical protein
MGKNGYDIATPVNRDPALKREPFLNLSSGYIMRAADRMPKQGDKDPWRNPQSYFRDILILRHGRINDGVMTFSKASAGAARNAADPMAVAAE